MAACHPQQYTLHFLSAKLFVDLQPEFVELRHSEFDSQPPEKAACSTPSMPSLQPQPKNDDVVDGELASL
jgi:hypothetical protein